MPNAGIIARIRALAGMKNQQKELGGIERWSFSVTLPGGLVAQFVHLGTFALVTLVGRETPSEKVCPEIASWGTQAWHPTYVRSFGPATEPQPETEVITIFKYYTPCLDDVVGTAVSEQRRYLEFIVPNTTDDDTVTWSWLVAHKIDGVLTRFRDTDDDLSGCAYAMCEMDSLFLVFSDRGFVPKTPAATFHITAKVSRQVGPKRIFTSMHIGGGVGVTG